MALKILGPNLSLKGKAASMYTFLLQAIHNNNLSAGCTGMILYTLSRPSFTSWAFHHSCRTLLTASSTNVYPEYILRFNPIIHTSSSGVRKIYYQPPLSDWWLLGITWKCLVCTAGNPPTLNGPSTCLSCSSVDKYYTTICGFSSDDFILDLALLCERG